MCLNVAWGKLKNVSEFMFPLFKVELFSEVHFGFLAKTLFLYLLVRSSISGVKAKTRAALLLLHYFVAALP